MATLERQIFGVPDSSGDVFPEPLEIAMTLGTAVLDTTEGFTILAPTGSDIGLRGSWKIPENYVDTPLLIIRCILCEAANVLGFGLQQYSRAHSETWDVAFEAEDLASNSTWTGLAAEEEYEEIITITPAAAYVKGDRVPFFFFRDDSVDDQTGEIHHVELFFRYNDA